MTVIIAGAGIGGLTLALSLHQQGIPFRVVEAVSALKPMGVGINLQPHAVRELYELGLEADLERIGLRTGEVAYFSAQGNPIWSEPRGTEAGYRWPQYSIHRGELQFLLLRSLQARAGMDIVQTGTALADWEEHPHGIRARLIDRTTGARRDDLDGEILVVCDGINSTARAKLYPDEGGAVWRGTMMWRGITDGPAFLSGRSMAMAGTADRKFVCYPIEDNGDGTVRINWVADLALPPGTDWNRQDWTREGRLGDFAPHFADWSFDWLDIPWVIANAEGIWEYPMVDRNPLPQWSFGRVTLLGDAAHAMYPIGSNGASQAILDARVLTREVMRRGRTPEALAAYDAARREDVNKIVLANRGDGPDKVLDVVAARAPDGFETIGDVMSAEELARVAQGYKALAGFDVETLNARPSLIEM
ncbi:flavin-dependent oxidoreductase [Rhodophyticola porphyridii]|uniref:flavin-dependent oxidoreductase n=1 Tax=Rhodophyticola porphyridii TaxID=1852017 RepID=UPI0035D07A48